MSESLAFDAAWLFAAFLALLVAAALFIAVRRFLLERGGGTVECGLRRGGSGAWRLGVASYHLDELRWYNAFGISQRPEETLGRRELAVVSRRSPDTGEEAALGPGRVIVECRLAGGGLVELGLAESALTGLLAWLEAAPPRYSLIVCREKQAAHRDRQAEPCRDEKHEVLDGPATRRSRTSAPAATAPSATACASARTVPVAL